MKVKVSKKITGTLVVSAISSAPMRKNEEHTITLDQYWHPTVQEAIKAKLLTVSGGGTPKPKDVVRVFKTCNGSVSLPIVKKILRDNTPFSIPVDLLENSDFKMLLKNGKIGIVGRTKIKGQTEEVVKEKGKHSDAVVWDARAKADAELEEAEKDHPKKIKRAAPKMKTKKKGENSLIIDTDSDEDDSVEMRDDVTWVDSEENAKRIQAHPLLSKKKGYKG